MSITIECVDAAISMTVFEHFQIEWFAQVKKCKSKIKKGIHHCILTRFISDDVNPSSNESIMNIHRIFNIEN